MADLKLASCYILHGAVREYIVRFICMLLFLNRMNMELHTFCFAVVVSTFAYSLY